MNYLIYDAAISGHHSEYLEHLILYLKSTTISTGDNYYFIVPEALKVEFPDLIQKSKDVECIKWFFISYKVVDDLYKSSLLKRSFKEYNLVKFYAEKTQASKVYLLYFNIFQIAFIFKRPRFQVSGILFLQFYRMNTSGLSNKIKYLRKYITTYLYTLNSKIEKIFVLNDSKTVEFLNTRFRNCFSVLPDPIPEHRSLENFELRDIYGVNNEKKIFLHAGSLDGRKGTQDILKSIFELDESVQLKVCLILAGKTKNPIEEMEIASLYSEVRDKTKAQIIWLNEFVSNELMKSLFEEADFILMPYKNPEASSGILGHAMRSNKPVISTDYGLLKEIIEIHKMGILIKLTSPVFIAEAINKSFSFKYEPSNINEYLSTHSAGNFASNLLNAD